MSTGAPPPGTAPPDARMLEAEELRHRLMGVPANRATRVEPAGPRRAAAPSEVAANLLEIARSLCTVITVAVFVLTFIAQPFRIPSESMERTLLVGDFLLVNKQIFAPAGVWGWLLPYRNPRTGDVVVFHYPLKPEEHVVKRVIGGPGDSVRVQDGLAWVNGEPLQEPYVVFEPAYPDAYRDDFPTQVYSDPGVDPQWWLRMQKDIFAGNLMVPAGKYFVMGDNRNFSRDSRYWGFVPRGDIVGRPLLIYFSLREPSSTDGTRAQDDRLGQKNDLPDRLKEFARWDRMFRVVR